MDYSKRPVSKFNIEPNSDEGSGVGSNSKNGSKVSGAERFIPPVNPIVNGIRQLHQLGIIQQQYMVLLTIIQLLIIIQLFIIIQFFITSSSLTAKVGEATRTPNNSRRSGGG
jgi:hypothetical protein